MFGGLRNWSLARWALTLGGAAIAGFLGIETWKHYHPDAAVPPAPPAPPAPPGTKPVDLTLSPEATCNAAVATLPSDPRTAFDGAKLPSYQAIAQSAIDDAKKTGNVDGLRSVADLIDSAVTATTLDNKYANVAACLRALADKTKPLFKTDPTPSTGAAFLPPVRRRI